MFFIKGASIGNHYMNATLYSALKWNEINDWIENPAFYKTDEVG